jgi:DNA-binding response OmpR family regulator
VTQAQAFRPINSIEYSNGFYQADDSATRTHEGTGIGLSLVKELLDLMKGTITVESEPGKGTVFTIQLEAEPLQEVPSAMDVRTINSFQPERERTTGIDHELPLLLVVEDNDELRAFVKESLSATWSVLEASNGLDAWAIIERELPEIVVCDVMMPGMNGFELCMKSKNDFRTAHIGFIMLTAKAAHEARIQGLECGADEYLTKPFHLYELELRIRNLLQEQHSLRKHLQEKLLSPIPSPKLPHVNDLFLSKLHAYLEEHISDSKLNLESVADAMAMSKSTMNRKLKVLLNSPVSEYIKKYRLHKATALLAAGLTVSEVSFRVGFETSSYFAQCFKEHFKKTPTEFVKIHL